MSKAGPLHKSCDARAARLSACLRSSASLSRLLSHNDYVHQRPRLGQFVNDSCPLGRALVVGCQDVLPVRLARLFSGGHGIIYDAIFGGPLVVSGSFQMMFSSLPKMHIRYTIQHVLTSLSRCLGTWE